MAWENTLVRWSQVLFSPPQLTSDEEIRKQLVELADPEEISSPGFAQLVDATAGLLAERARLCDRVVELQRREQTMTQRQQDLLIRTEELNRELDATGRRHLVLNERNRIAQDLHDRAAQTLFLIDMKSQWLLNHLPPDSPMFGEMEKLRELASEGSAQLREAIYALRASELKHGGLVAGLGQLVTRVEAEGLAASFTVTGRAVTLSTEQEDAIFMVAQEALSNVRKHSRATAVMVALRFSDDEVTLVVQDDGAGLSEEALEDPKRLGVKGMRQRVETLGGRFSLLSDEESGLIVRASIPYTRR